MTKLSPLIEREKVTITSLVPPLVQLWLSARSWEKTDLSSLKVLQVGGSRFESELAKQVTPVLGCQLQQVFGMAEGLLCYTRLDDAQEVIINTQGRPLSSGDEIRVVNIDGELVKPGEVGELQTRGPYTIRAYYRATQHNATAFSDDGFYKSGDLVRQTASGNIIVEGRIKEQINRAGEKISVAEIEQLLNEHPDISSSVLVAVPDERLGERSCAFIITPNPLSLSDIRQYLNAKGLSRYKWPDQLEIVTSWPLTAVGKVDKKHLLANISKSAKQTPSTRQYVEYRLPICSNPMELALKIIQSQDEQVYAIYEKNGEWSVGLGRYASICADAHQAEIRIDADNKHQPEIFKRDRLCEAINEATKSIPITNWRAYGTAKFELSHVFLGVESEHEVTKNLLELFIPRIEVRLTQEQALIRTIDAEQLVPLIKLVERLDHECLSQDQESLSSKVHADIREHRQDEYKSNVKNAVAEIQSGQYQKVILSRRIPLPASVDLIESYRNGRLNNTPTRSFLMSYGHEKLAGFSPETVVEVSAEGLVSTQPLAGTRSLGSSPKEEQELREELLADSKEIAEHAMSVKLAQEELAKICKKESISICEFMAIRRRGSVQHLASRLTGQLAQGKNAWDAFESLFPAVTASGIPKKESIDAIKRFESEAREWYSGCVMILDSNGSMDAALVLRSIYQRGEPLWLQAGAGIIAQSKPERELEETIEKLSCISQHLFTKKMMVCLKRWSAIYVGRRANSN
ncbi:salicylate synthase [Psychromonas hadalis]|uniref:salicylate synthase n=1 Tax=Psychromonas hadalis TaxID=211669 RepID=UPI0004239D11|nr:salicylate synthase [Psychromonas hadalis]